MLCQLTRIDSDSYILLSSNGIDKSHRLRETELDREGEGEGSSYHGLCSLISSISDEVGNEASISCLSPELLTSDNAELMSCCISVF